MEQKARINEQETTIQQHITKIGILQEENKSLEQDIEHLKSRVQDMEATVRNQDQQLQVNTNTLCAITISN